MKAVLLGAVIALVATAAFAGECKQIPGVALWHCDVPAPAPTCVQVKDGEGHHVLLCTAPLPASGAHNCGHTSHGYVCK